MCRFISSPEGEPAVDDESFSFDPIAAAYEETWPHLFAEDVVTPAVDLLAELAGMGSAIELGIGTGRIALPLHARGVPVSGIDASKEMVARMREKPGGMNIATTIGDFSTSPLGGTFSLAYLVRNTLWNLRTQERQVACFQNVADHLESGGRFVLEMFVPDLTNVSPGNTIKALRADPRGWSFDVYDIATQHSSSHHYWITSSGIRHFGGEGRYAWPAEIDLMASLAGMRLQDRWSGWKREPFTESSTYHVSVYEKR